MFSRSCIVLVTMLSLVGCGAAGPKEGERPAAQGKGQDLAPIDRIDTWLNALHVAKEGRGHMAEVNHYCDVVDDTLIQCALYDRTGPRAHLVGVEYVLSEAGFDSLPRDERPYWHPHNYEVLSGMLVAPGMPAGQEDALMRRLLNSYGKTWHTWPMGRPGDAAPALPVGDPQLGWSFNADNEAPLGLVSARDRRLGVDSRSLRELRAPLVRDANPQEGVNAMAAEFPTRQPMKGVREVYPTDRPGPGTR
jgi:hypothetical protein